MNVIRFYRQLPRTDPGYFIGRQLLRAGTSVGANYRPVCRSRSDREFIAKLGTAIEESDETAFWLEILVEAELVAAECAGPLRQEADELTRIFVASRQTKVEKLRARAQARAQKPR